MKTFTFTLAILAASVAAQEPTTSDNMADNMLDKIKLWNCATCTAAFKGIDSFIDSDTLQEPVMKIATKICKIAFGYGDPEICPGAISSYSPPAFEALSRYVLGKERWCNEIFEVCTHVKVEEQDLHDVVNRILATKPASLANDDFIDKMYDVIAADTSKRDIIRTVQISDVHMDLEYMPGTNA